MNIEKVLLEARSRWLKPAEVVEILKNYLLYEFQLNVEPPYLPKSGSLYLYDRKVVRFFRRDGHNWRKKKDGKTVREAHEKLKAGSVDVLHCYYAHSDDDDRFQRRCYWLLDETMEHIVLVHYREVEKGVGRVQPSPKSSAPTSPTQTAAISAGISGMDVPPVGSPSGSRHDTMDSGSGTESLGVAGSRPQNRFLTGGDFESIERHPWSHVNREHAVGTDNGMNLDFTEHGKQGYGITSEYGTLGFKMQMIEVNGGQSELQPGPPFQAGQRDALTGNNSIDIPRWLRSDSVGQMPGVVYPVNEGASNRQDALHNPLQVPWNGLLPDISPGGSLSGVNHLSLPESQKERSGMKRVLSSSSPHNLFRARPSEENFGNWFHTKDSLEQKSRPPLSRSTEAQKPQELTQPHNSQLHKPVCHEAYPSNPSFLDILRDMSVGKAGDSAKFPSVSSGRGSLRDFAKLDSFGRWMQEMDGEPPGSILQKSIFASSGDRKGCISPEPDKSPSRILFSVRDFSPDVGSINGGTKVLIAGESEAGPSQKWGCLFGSVEVSAEVISPGVLKCIAPPHVPGTVTFAVTADDGVACSEILQFEYTAGPGGTTSSADDHTRLQIQLLHLLLHNDKDSPITDEEWANLESCYHQPKLPEDLTNRVITLMFKHLVASWTHRGGLQVQGSDTTDVGVTVIHLAAALGYDWAIKMLTACGTDVDLKDARGCTPLHWAAACGQEKSVVALLAAGATPAVLASLPTYSTPADLAAGSGHPGIASYLAQMSLSNSLSSLSLHDRVLHPLPVQPATDGGSNPAENQNEGREGVLGSTEQAAASMETALGSSQERDGSECVMKDDGGAGYSHRQRKRGQRDNDRVGAPVSLKVRHEAALKIQRQYKGWKDRKRFLSARQSVTKLQACVKGHLVRKDVRKG